MGLRRLRSAVLILLVSAGVAAGQAPVLPAGDHEPLFRLEAGGPTSLVTALAFSPDGESLYEAGWDKVVRVWTRDARTGMFALDAGATYRVPIGPGTDGAINAMALSSDGAWLAVAGNGIVRGGAGFRQLGLMVPAPAKSDEMRMDQGLIYVYSTRTEPRTVRLLRGHLGPVYSLAFAPAREDKPPLLVSTGQERDDAGAVRLWDVERGEALAALGDLPVPTTRPGLAAWHTGPERNQVGVALAWGDGTFRLWDVGRDRDRLRIVPDGLENNTAAYLPASAQILTGSFRNESQQGRLTIWETGASGATPARAVPIPSAGGYLDVPRAVALVATRPGGAPDHVAVVLRRVPDSRRAPAGQAEDALQLIDLRPEHFGAVSAQVTLWKIAGQSLPQTVLAVDPGGRSLAVAGHPGREVEVYAVADLLRGRAVPQRIRGAGVTIRQAALVKKGPDWGLWLCDTARGQAPAPGDAPAHAWIFDPTQRRLRVDQAGWHLAAPDTTGWTVDVVPAGRDAQGRPVPASVTVRQGAGPEHRIRLKPRQVVTEWAMLPPRPPRAEPIVAIAYHEAGEPGLGLYNGLTGEQVRQLTGHAERVQSLAFSDDGRLLLSTAEDRTVCVWSLTDLDQTLGKRGTLDGVAVTETAGGLVVTRLEPDSPAQGDGSLRVGDVIQGVVEAGKLRPLAAMTEFYRDLAQLQPGRLVTLRRVRAGTGPMDVSLRVGQAADERKPLLSLFMVPGQAPGAPSWIGWSPLGPFESSDRAAERLLGWHFNTGDPAAPARFARADQYRDKFYRVHLLKDLMEHGELPPPRPLDPGKMGVNIDPEGTFDHQNQLLIRQPPATLKMAFLDRPLLVDQVESVRWRIDDAPLQDMGLAADRPPEWSADLSPVRWSRGVHRIQVVLRTREASPQEFSETRLVRFQPLPPTVELGAMRERLVVDRPEFRYQAQVRPSRGRIQVQLIHEPGQGPRSRKDWESGEPVKIGEPLTLEPGTNTIDLVACNAEAPADDRELETVRRRVVVVYNRKPDPPPTVALQALSGPRDGSEEGPTWELVRGGPTVVTVPKVRVEGIIRSREKLTQVEWIVGGVATAQELPPSRPDPLGMAATVSRELALTPEPLTVRLRAKSAFSEFAEDGVVVRYQPQVPVVEEMILEPPDPVVYQEPGADPPRVRLKARLAVPGDRRPFDAVVLVNGQEQPAPRPLIDAAAETLAVEIPLRPGDNQVQVRLSNAWDARSFSKPIGVVVKRPPRVHAPEQPALGPEPSITVSASADTPDDLPLTRARIVIRGGGGRAPRKVIEREGTFRRAGASWIISAEDVPIEPGANEVEVWAWNEDGPCREPGRRTGVVFTPPPPPKPEVAFIRPADDACVDRPEYRVEFRVRSASALKRVELVRLGTAAGRERLRTVDTARVSRDDRGDFVVQEGLDVSLGQQANRLELLAVNAGGEAAATMSLSYIPPPVHVVIDRLVPKDRPDRPIIPVVREDNRLEFVEPAPEGQVWLHGRVVWPDRETKRTKDQNKAEVWINGARYSLVLLDPRRDHPLEREFHAGLLLDKEKNEIEIRLPGLAREAGDRPRFQLGCLHPEQRLRLHLLLVGVGQTNKEELRDRVLQALNGSLVPGSRGMLFRTSTNAEGIIYYPLVGDVRKTEFLGQIWRIKSAIRPRLTATEEPHELVLICCQGGEWIEEGKFSLRLRPGKNPTDDLAMEELANLFDGMRGVQLCFLEVRTSTAPPPPLARGDFWEGHDAPIALFRVAWPNRTDGRRIELPERARLFASLAEAIPQALTMNDVDSNLATFYDNLEINPKPFYDRHLEPALGSLIIGKP